MDCIVVRILTVVIFLNHNCTHTKKSLSFYSPRGTSKYWKVVITDTFHVATNSNCPHSKRFTSIQPVASILISCHSREHAEKNTAARPVAVWPVTHVCHWPECAAPGSCGPQQFVLATLVLVQSYFLMGSNHLPKNRRSFTISKWKYSINPWRLNKWKVKLTRLFPRKERGEAMLERRARSEGYYSRQRLRPWTWEQHPWPLCSSLCIHFKC